MTGVEFAECRFAQYRPERGAEAASKNGRNIYFRQKKLIVENNCRLHNKIEDKLYTDLDEILGVVENNYIKVYLPMIKEYKMIDRALSLNC